MLLPREQGAGRERDSGGQAAVAVELSLERVWRCVSAGESSGGMLGVLGSAVCVGFVRLFPCRQSRQLSKCRAGRQVRVLVSLFCPPGSVIRLKYQRAPCLTCTFKASKTGDLGGFYSV